MANESLRQQLALLYQLQEQDRELLSIHEQLQAIPQRIEQLAAGVTKYKLDITETSEALAEAEKEQRAKNAELQMNDEQRKKYRNEQRTVTSNEAYSALERQIEYLDKKDEETEETILELMEACDVLKKELAELEAQVTQEDISTTQKTDELRQEKSALEKEMTEKLARRTEFLPKIEQNLSAQYHRWLERRKTDFVALAKKGTCGSCRLTIQPQNLKEAQKYEKLVYCASCKRVLYVEPFDPDTPFP